MRKIVLSIFVVLMSCFGAVAQNQQVTGTVVDDSGNTVIGATVSVKGTTVAVTTDVNGGYVITAPKEGVLVFSFVGMTEEEVPIAGKTTINVTMKAATQLIDDVIVTAFGQSTKEAFTGSASVLDSEALAKSTATNVVNTLAGKMPGVQIRSSDGAPGSEASIRIRGFGSLYAGNNPLIILDGAPYSGSLSALNSADFESFTVLKDAASNALYGARGANGVIMITTKKGTRRGDAIVSVDIKVGVNTNTMQNYDVITDPGQFYETYYGGLNSYYLTTEGLTAEAAHIKANEQMVNQLGYNVFTVPDDGMLIDSNGRLQTGATLGRNVDIDTGEIDEEGNPILDSYWIQPDNWADYAYKTSTRQEYNVSVVGGDERMSFFGSVGYLNDDGIVAMSGYERITARLKADYQAKKWLKIGGNMSYAHIKRTNNSAFGDGPSTGNIFAYTSSIAPIYPLFVRGGDKNIKKDVRGMDIYDFGNGNNAELTRVYLGGGNPLAVQHLDNSGSAGNNFSAHGFVDINFTKNLKLHVNASTGIIENRSHNYTNPYYGLYASDKGRIGVGHTRFVNNNFQQLLTYDKTIGSHSFDVMIGHEYTLETGASLSASKKNMASTDIFELNNAITDVSGSSAASEYLTEGYMGRVQYNYDQKYFASASYRRDASSNFHPDHRWGNFWSLGGAWVISKENFMQGVDAVDMLKFKASIGSQGNDKIGANRFYDSYEIVNADGVVSVQFVTPGNPEITWETNTNFNTGFEFALLGNRLIGNIDFYYRLTEDLLFQRPAPESAGYRAFFDNIGNIANYGVELALTGVLVNTKNINWSISANITHNKNKIVSLPPERMVYDGFNSGSFWLTEGISMYTFYMPKFAGLTEHGESIWYKNETKEDENGVEQVVGQTTTTIYSEATDYVAGTALPDFYGGFSTYFEAYGFDLSVNFDYQVGGLTYDGVYAGLMSAATTTTGNGGAIHKDVLGAWSTQNPSSTIPRFQFLDEGTGSQSDRYLVSSSYLNLQSINVGYTLPANLLNKLKIGKIRIYCSIENVAYWSKRKGLDPRQSWTGSAGNQNYSPIRSVVGGLQITF